MNVEWIGADRKEPSAKIAKNRARVLDVARKEKLSTRNIEHLTVRKRKKALPIGKQNGERGSGVWVATERVSDLAVIVVDFSAALKILRSEQASTGERSHRQDCFCAETRGLQANSF